MFPSLRRAQKRSYSSLLGCSVCAASARPSPMTYATTEAADMIQPVTVSAVSAEPPKAIIKPDTSPTVAIQSFLLVNFLIQSIFISLLGDSFTHAVRGTLAADFWRTCAELTTARASAILEHVKAVAQTNACDLQWSVITAEATRYCFKLCFL